MIPGAGSLAAEDGIAGLEVHHNQALDMAMATRIAPWTW